MGKAIVIKDLNVPNPLTTVTFLNPENVLAAYLTANTSISQTEETALKAFVDSLLNAGLYTKMRYFYPMLGDNVNDMVLDAISPSTEDLFSNWTGKTDLTVTDRVLISSVSQYADYTPFDNNLRFKTTDWKNLGVISATYHGTLNGASVLRVQGQTGNNTYNIYPLSDKFTYRPPVVLTGHNGSALNYVPDEQTTDERSYLDRIIFADLNGSSAKIYKENTLYASGTSYTANMTGLNTYTLLRGNTLSCKFFALTDNLTAEEWGTFYNLLTAFLVAVGKRSA